jgi:thioredoxin domain-containing protein 5
MKHIISILLVTLCSVVLGIDGNTGGEVVQLTDRTFDGAVGKGVWMIKFFAPWCGHCRSLAPVWEEYAKIVGNEYHVGEVDCTTSQEVAKRFGISGYPTIKLFENGQFIADANVRRTVGEFIRFAELRIPSLKGRINIAIDAPTIPPQPATVQREEQGETKVQRLDAKSFGGAIEKGTWFIKFFAPWCGHCKKLAPIWEELYHQQQERKQFHVAEVDCTTDADICAKYLVHGYPTILLCVSHLFYHIFPSSLN